MDYLFKTTRHFACPECGAPSSDTSHMETGRSTRWYCDGCGRQCEFTIGEESIDIQATESRLVKTLVLLRSVNRRTHDDTIWIVVEGMKFVKDGEALDLTDNDAYFYNEHTCPTNFMRVEAVLYRKDDDPHGVFEWVETIIRPKDFDSTELHNDEGYAGWTKLFKSLPPKASCKRCQGAGGWDRFVSSTCEVWITCPECKGTT